MHTHRRRLLACLVFVTAAAASLVHPSPASAQAEWGFSPGIKVAWSPGQRVTYGLEVSFVRVPDLLSSHSDSLARDVLEAAGRAITRTYGLVWNLDTTFRGFVSMRVGGEWVGPFVGLELGPAFVRDQDGRHFGFGITAWAGYDLYAFYTHTFVRGGRPVDQFGFYLKTPLLSFERGNSIDFDDDE